MTNTPSLNAFSQATDGQIPEGGTITKFVVMGKELAQEAIPQAYENFKETLRQKKIMAIDFMKNVGDTIKKVMPGGGLEAKGHETEAYSYNREKNATLFGAAPKIEPG